MRSLFVVLVLAVGLALGGGSCDCGGDDWTIQDCAGGRQWTHHGGDLICYDESPQHWPLTYRPWLPTDNGETACAFCDGVYNPDGGYGATYDGGTQ